MDDDVLGYKGKLCPLLALVLLNPIAYFVLCLIVVFFTIIDQWEVWRVDEAPMTICLLQSVRLPKMN